MKTPAALFASFEGDEIEEIHQYFDLMGLMKQLGATPERCEGTGSGRRQVGRHEPKELTC